MSEQRRRDPDENRPSDNPPVRGRTYPELQSREEARLERLAAERAAENNRLNRIIADLRADLADAVDARDAAKKSERAAIAKAEALQQEIDRSLARAPGSILAAARSLAEIIKALAETDEKLYEANVLSIAERLNKGSDYIQNLSHEKRLELIEELARRFFAMLSQ